MTTIGQDGRIAAAVGLTALGAFALAALLAGSHTTGTAGTTTGAGSMGMMGGAVGPGIAPFLFMLLPLAAALLLAFVAVRALSAGGSAESEERDARQDAVDGDPIERLQRRYTEGELSESEFERALEREMAGDESANGIAGDQEPRERSEPASDR